MAARVAAGDHLGQELVTPGLRNDVWQAGGSLAPKRIAAPPAEGTAKTSAWALLYEFPLPEMRVKAT